MSFHASLIREEEAPRKVEGINRTDQSLKNPLIGTEVRFCLESCFLPHHIRAFNLIKAKNHPSKDYYKLFRRVVLNPNVYPIGVLIRAAETILQIIITTWKLQHMAKPLTAAVRYALTNPRVRQHLELSITYQRIVRQVSYSRESDIGPKRIGDLSLTFIQSLVVAHLGEESCLMTYNHFLAAADTAKSRCHLLIAAVIQGALWEYGSFLDYIFELIDVIDSIDTNHDDYFTIIKSISPYSKGLVMSSYNTTVKTEFETVFQINTMCPRLDSLLKKLLVLNPNLLLMISSVEKSWYFPEINMVDGPKDQFHKMRVDIDAPSSILQYGQELLTVFRAEFIKGYVAKHAKWPPVFLTAQASKSLHNARELGRWSPSFDRNWKLFSEVVILKIADLDLDPDFNDIVSDKAIINSRKDWTFEYNAAAYRRKYGEQFERPRNRSGPSRLVNALIDGRLDDIPGLLLPFYRGAVEFDDRITVLVPKEKELKVKGRFFSKQSLAIRIYQVIAEATLKNEIMPYLKTHSMTMSSTALTHLLNKLSRQIITGDSFVINLDYSSWCNGFRPELQMPICRQLDQMFDCGYFFRTGCTLPCFTTFIMQDRFNPPRLHNLEPVEDGETCISGAKTMGEGMRQKLWTILTSCWETIALRDVGVTFNILGQGDNQTIIVYKSLAESNQSQADRALGSLYKHARLAGHHLKMEECWVSDCLYEYGKRLFFKGIPVPGSLKQLSRVTDSTGELFPNLYSKLACLVSSCLSAAMSDTSPWVALTTGICLYLIELYVELPASIMQDESLLTTLCLVGPALGGLPTPATLPSVFFRGMSDPLPLQLALLQTLISTTSISSSFVNRVVKLTIAAYPDWLSLVTDPTSLNIAQVFRPERQIRKWVEEAISASSHSSRVGEFFQQPLTEMAQLLARDLSTMMPLRPRDMSALFGLSNVAYGLSVIDLFQKSSTVVAANQAIHLEDVVIESQRYKDSIIARVLDQSEGVDITPYLDGCTYLAAKRLRRLTWGRELVGVTMPFVAEQFVPCNSQEATIDDYQDAVIYCPQEPLRMRHLSTRGDQPLYLGSNTAIKVQKGDITGLNKSRAASLVRDTLVLYQWYKVRKVIDPNLSKLMDCFLREKGYTSEIRPNVQGGTLTHRLPSRGDSRQGLTGYVNILSTWLRFTSDYLQTYSHSSDDYTIHFQHVFTFGCLYADSVIRSGGIISKPYILSASCPTCFEKIESEEFLLACEPQYRGAEWLIRKPVSIPESIADVEVEFDPCISASISLGILIGKSLLVDIRANQSDITEQRTWANLERFSLTDVRKLPWSIIIRALWRFIINARLLTFEKSGLIKMVSGFNGPTFSFLNQVFKESALLLETTPIERAMSKLNFRDRKDLISKILLFPISNYEVAHLESMRIDAKYQLISEANIDLYLASAKGVSTGLTPIINETNDFTSKGSHHGNYSLSGVKAQAQSQLVKMVIRKLGLSEIYVYPDVDPEIVLDLCHLSGVSLVLILAGDPKFYETLLELDLCNAVKTRVDLRRSLALRTPLGYYIGSGNGPHQIVFEALETASYAHPCLEELNFNVFIDSNSIDVTDMCCLPLSNPCASLFKPVFSNVSNLKTALLSSYSYLLDLLMIKGFDIRPVLEEFDELVLASQTVLNLKTAWTMIYYVGIVHGQAIISRTKLTIAMKKLTVHGRLPSASALRLREAPDLDLFLLDIPPNLLFILRGIDDN
ncbi:L protein [Aquatic bird bornavirus 2]|uniref:RNA-directed RNA polymerase n=1 Tax=Aquatic bird bornavirus 2 TaxID=1884917 RepID=A0A076N9E3_9MONO|nr:RNA-dependent RNA polymerase [Aquatic bird bornavirus 2]AIJ27440.1 L protein [Aquatic bird bornavirus 2]